MADKEISTLTAAGTLTGAELIHGVQSGNSRKITTLAIRNLLPTFRGALVTKSIDQTTANYTGGAMVAWDSESYDTDAIHDNVTNNTRLTVPSGVTKVRLTAQIWLSAVTAAAESCWLKIAKNGTTDNYLGAADQLQTIASTGRFINVSSPVLTVVATDYFETQLFMGTDTSITVAANTSWFAMEIIA